MQNIRNFFIAFGVSLVVFFVAASLLMGSINFPGFDTENPDGEVTDPNKDSEITTGEDFFDEKEIKGNSFTALLACTDDYTGELDSILLLRINKERSEYIVSSLPTNMVLSMDGIEYYLGDLVKDKGTEFFLDKIYGVTGMKVDYYAFISLQGFVNIIDELGTVTFDVPQDMYFEDYAGNILVDLKKGVQELDGAKALELVRFRGYENGDAGRMEIQKKFLHAVLGSFLKVENLGKSSEIFFKIRENIDTNFTVDDFINNLRLIFMYEKYEKVEIEYPGTTNKKGDITRFIPKIENALAQYRAYR